MAILTFLLYTIFLVSCLFLIIIVLLQEGKGGGFGEAFGGIASETFGVRASGVTKVTAGLAAVFLLSAVLISIFHTDGSSVGIGGAVESTQSTEVTPPTGAGTDTDADTGNDASNGDAASDDEAGSGDDAADEDAGDETGGGN